MSVNAPAMAQGWFKSRKSNCNGACVEVRFDLPSVFIRDSKAVPASVAQQTVPVITVPVPTWEQATLGLADADFGTFGTLVAEPAGDGGARLCCLVTGTVLTFTAIEWDAFLDGVRAGEFQPALAPA